MVYRIHYSSHAHCTESLFHKVLRDMPTQHMPIQQDYKLL